MADIPTLTVEDYWRLPRPTREAVDVWLRAEGLIERKVTAVRCVEGGVLIDHYEHDEDGRVVALVNDQGELEASCRTGVYVRVSCWPPPEAFAEAG